MICDDARPLLPLLVDGELGPADAEAVRAHIRICAGCAERYRQLASISQAARSASYFPAPSVLSERIFAQLPEAPSRVRIAAGPLWWQALAALIPVAVVSASLAAYVAGHNAGPDIEEQVVSSHIRSLMAGHLTDVPSSDQHTVKPWFNGKLDVAPPVRDLTAEGFALIGGRLDYIGGRPVAALIYRHRLHVINVFVWPQAGASASAPAFDERQGYNIVRWTGRDTAYWAISDLNREDMAAFQKLLAEPEEREMTPAAK